MRVGIVGVGMMGKHHARVYSEIKNCKLIGIVDKDIARAREVASTYGTVVIDSIDEMVRQRPDAVSIAVPTSLHKEVASIFLREGIDCLVEKPIAPTVEDAEAIISAAKKSGAILMVGHIERFNPAVMKLKEMIQAGELGKLFILTTKRSGPFSPRIKDVGIIVDLATHDIDVTRFLVGREPRAVYAGYGKYRRDVEDYALILLDFGGTIAGIEASRFTPYKVRTLAATGSEAMACLDYIEQSIEVYSSTTRRTVGVNKKEPLKVELEHFIECVSERKRPLVDGNDGLMNLKVALAALRSGGG